MLRLRTVRTTHIMPTKAILGPAHIQGYVGTDLEAMGIIIQRIVSSFEP